MPTRQPIDSERLQVRPMQEADACAPFECGDADLNQFLGQDAWPYMKQGAGRTSVALYDGDLVGYVTTLADSIVLKTPEKKKLALPSIYSVPAVKIGRLAVEQAFRENYRGLGELLVRAVIAEALAVGNRIGVRLITVDAYLVSVPFCEKQKFVKNKGDNSGRSTVPMHLDLHRDDLPL